MNEAAELTPEALGYRMPAEWHAHEATWMAWPHNASDWPGRFDRVEPVFVAIIAELSRVERVRLLVSDETERARVTALLAAGGAQLDEVDVFVAATDRSWTRDFVPSFVLGPRGRAAVKWCFNGWARYPDHERDDAAGERVAEWLSLPSFLPAVDHEGGRRRIVLEGGAIDTDGAGTFLVSEQCLLGNPYGRNPWLGRAGTDRVLADWLGARAVIWLGEGIAGDDTFGHVDDFARFVRRGTVLLAEEKDPRDPNHRALEESRELLEAARDAGGSRLEVIRIPMPAPLADEGQRLPASYANFYVANDIVLVPTFNDPADAQALGILSELFTGRRIIGVDSSDLVLGLGTIHCSTQQEPAAG